MSRSGERTGWLLATLFVVGGCHGAARVPDEAMRPVDCKVDMDDTQLGGSDVFDVRVYDDPDLSGTYRVAADGTINFPLVGQIQIDGLTPNEAGKKIADQLAQGFLRNPHVSIFVKEYNSKKVSVLGQVSKPGTFPYAESMTIIQAVTAAGGFTPIANKNETVVTRTDHGRKIRMQIRAESISEGHERNFCLRPGDIVFVPERIF